MFPPAVRSAWQEYKPTGKVNVLGAAAVTINGSSVPAIEDYNCTLTANGVGVSHLGWPESIHDIRGSVTATPGKLVATGISAKSGPLLLTANGSYVTDSGACHLTGIVTSEHLLGGWISKLPPGTSQFFDAHKTDGELTLAVTQLERGGGAGEPVPPWNYTADLEAKHFSMNGLVALDADQLRLATKGSVTGTDIDFTGQLTGTNVGLAGKTFDTLAATLALSGADHSLHVTDIDGKVAGGSVQGTIIVQPGGGRGVGGEAIAGHYEADLSLKDAEMAQLICRGGRRRKSGLEWGTGGCRRRWRCSRHLGLRADRTAIVRGVENCWCRTGRFTTFRWRWV